MSDMEKISEILNSNFTKEQKEVLLKTLADGMIESMKKEEKKDPREALIEKNKEQAEKTREKVAEYEKRSYEEEKKRLEEEQKQKRDEEREKEIKEKEELLSYVKNNNGERIYKDLSNESGFEIEEIYHSLEMYNPKALEDAKKEMEKDKITVIEVDNKQEKQEPEKQQGPKLFTNEEINEVLKSAESNSVNEASPINVENNPSEIKEEKPIEEKEEQQNASVNNEEQFNLEREKPKKVSMISRAKDKLTNIVNGKNAKAIAAVIAGVSLVAIAVVNLPAAVAAGLGGFAVNEFNKGKKL